MSLFPQWLDSFEIYHSLWLVSLKYLRLEDSNNIYDTVNKHTTNIWLFNYRTLDIVFKYYFLKLKLNSSFKKLFYTIQQIEVK